MPSKTSYNIISPWRVRVGEDASVRNVIVVNVDASIPSDRNDELVVVNSRVLQVSYLVFGLFAQDLQTVAIVEVPHSTSAVTSASYEPSPRIVERHASDRLITVRVVELEYVVSSLNVPELDGSALRATYKLSELFIVQTANNWLFMRQHHFRVQVSP